MDLVYILSPGDETELRYSIRSMVKNLTGWNRLFIVGHKPISLQNFIHIPAEDKYEFNRARNIYQKLLLACKDRRLSKQFIACSDDYFLLKDYNAATFPYFHCGDLSDQLRRLSPENYYRAHVENTQKALQARQLSTLNFNVHCPILYSKEEFRTHLTSYDWDIKKGYISKSLYANTLKIEGELVQDCKIHTPKVKAGIYRKIRDAKFFSTNEFSLNADMREVLQELFPDPSRWEKG